MCLDAKFGNSRHERSIAVDWHDCAWQPRIEVQILPPRRRAAMKSLFPAMPVLLSSRRHLFSFKPMKTNPLHSRRHRAGFTLIELLVVISIIAILAALLLPVLARVRISAQKAQAKLQIQDIVTAIQHYDSTYGRFPISRAAQAAAIPTGGDFTYGGTFVDDAGATETVGTPGYTMDNSEVMAM